MKRILLLGYGYTARAIEALIKKSAPGIEIFRSSRQGAPHIRFDLNNRNTWEKIPSVDGTFWTFPAEPEGQVKTFLEHYQHHLGKIVVIGTTRAFATTNEHQEVDETTSLDERMERVRGENLIRMIKGTAVYAAGIYGPQRNPVDWVRKGWVGPSPKFLNVIHVQDLAEICWAAMAKGKQGALYIAADNSPHSWEDLIDRWLAQYDLELPSNAIGSTRKSKKVNSLKSLTELEVRLKYPDIFVGTSELESRKN